MKLVSISDDSFNKLKEIKIKRKKEKKRSISYGQLIEGFIEEALNKKDERKYSY